MASFRLTTTACKEHHNTVGLDWWKLLLFGLVPGIFILIAIIAIKLKSLRKCMFPFRDQPTDYYNE